MTSPTTTTDPGKGMLAKFPSTCIRCFGPIETGAPIFFTRGKGARHTDCQPAEPPPLEGDLKRVVEFLHAEGEKGPLSPFYASLANQYVTKRTLSPKQIKTVLDRMDEEDLPGPEQVPAGRYALYNEDGVMYFVKVWRARNKPTFVRCYLLAGPSEDETQVNVRDVLKALLEAGVGDAAALYGRTSGNCSQCAYGLKNRLSRHMGLGPVCGDNVYPHMVWLAMKAKARAELRLQGLDPNETLVESEATR